MPVVRRPHTRNTKVQEPFGICHLTRRFRNHELNGFQMTCTRPEHNLDRKCTKECSISAGGGEQMTRRLLKAWVVMAAASKTLDDHRESWKTIAALGPEFCPTEAELDANAPIDWGAYECTDLGASPPIEPPTVVHQPAADRNILGEANEGIAEVVHQRLVDMALGGFLPITSAAQRARQKKTPGTVYGVPHWLSDALTHGYISPNLPPPANFVWRCRAGQWMLVRLGG